MDIIQLVPFLAILACIAILPVQASHFWDNNRNKLYVSLGLAFPILASLIFSGKIVALEHVIFYDYIPFIILLMSLFVVTGGIFIEGDIEATPKTNTLFLAVGGILASLMVTTGAAMLLIRVLLHTNKERKRTVHTVLFFIFIVANSGGLLTPLGDPPLFVMYLRGVPFGWFLKLFPIWLFVNCSLLLLYYLLDRKQYSLEDKESLSRDHDNIRPITVQGRINFIYLLAIVACVAFVNTQSLPVLSEIPLGMFLREMLLLFICLLSWKTTPHLTRVSNSFSWHPIEEVAFLFIGIFITMIPCLEYLRLHAGTLGVQSVTQYYFLTGILSSILDNTPTAMTFFSLAQSMFQQTPLSAGVNSVVGINEIYVEAIATASVLWGAMTYIGNGPNFMVKSIAENNNIKMPGFFSYMKYSVMYLLPIYILVYFIFLR